MGDGGSGGGSSGISQPGACRHDALATFVLSAWSVKTGLPSHTRAWSIDADGAKLTLSLAPDNRWCAHVQRPHRSNGTFLRVDLRQCCFAQFCFDADCRASGFRGSDALPIPPPLCEAVLRAEQPTPPPPPPPPPPAWLSEEELAALPLDEIVEQHRLSQQQQQQQPQQQSESQPHEESPSTSDTASRTQPSPTAPAILQDGPEWLSDEALSAVPLE